MQADEIIQKDFFKRFLFINQCLKGVGQIMLQENAITGLLFLIGIFLGRVEMGIAVIVSVLVSTYTAYLLKYDKENINKGLYGFNAALIGAALILFCKPAFIIWCSIIVGAAISTILQNYFSTKKLPVFTLPFVLLTWVILYFIKYLSPQLVYDTLSANIAGDYGFVWRGYGQVIFQDNIFSGIIFFIAVFICSPIAALYGLAASISSVSISLPFLISTENINSGLVGYNGVLCAIVFAGSKIKDGILVLLSVLLATIISQLMSYLSFPQLTFPFVAASIIVLILKNKIKFFKQ